MKELSLYKIRDLALSSGRAVYTVQQLANLIGKPKPVANVYFSRLVEKGLARRLLRGRIAFTDNDFVIASQLVEPSYISLDSALLYHQVRNQVPSNVQCISSRNSVRFEQMGIVYHKIVSSLFFGYRRISTEGSYILMADPEKALIDGYYLNRYSQDELLEYSDDLDFVAYADKLANYKGKGSLRLKEVILLLTEKR